MGRQTLPAALGGVDSGAVPAEVDQHPVTGADPGAKRLHLAQDAGAGGLPVAQFDDGARVHTHGSRHASRVDQIPRHAR